jgi:hypothetical protein
MPEVKAEFKSKEAEELTEKQISEFIDNLIERSDGQKILTDLRDLLTAGRNQMGWKSFGRMMLEALK